MEQFNYNFFYCERNENENFVIKDISEFYKKKTFRIKKNENKITKTNKFN